MTSERKFEAAPEAAVRPLQKSLKTFLFKIASAKEEKVESNDFKHDLFSRNNRFEDFIF